MAEVGASGLATLIPVKSFRHAKGRLAGIMNERDRADLAQHLAEGVIAASRSTFVAVVCDDDSVARWATEQGADVIWAPGRGLNPAVAFGVHELASRGFARIRIVHGDLIDPSELTSLPDLAGVLLVPDRFENGTNVIELPSGVEFEFSYGPKSFQRHVAAAKSLSLPLSILKGTSLGHDVDVPTDLI